MFSIRQNPWLARDDRGKRAQVVFRHGLEAKFFDESAPRAKVVGYGPKAFSDQTGVFQRPEPKGEVDVVAKKVEH